jgi:hypothetical protein
VFANSDSPLRPVRPAPAGLALLLLLGLGLTSVGCQRAVVDEPLAQRFEQPNEPAEQSAFWYRLQQEPMVSYDTAFHALLLMLQPERPAPETYEQRTQRLKDAGWLNEGFDRPAREVATRGRLARVLCKALDIKGGVVMRVVGPVPRYATRELRFRSIYPASSPNQVFTGGQWIGVLGRVVDFQRDQAEAADQRAAAPAEPARNPPAEDSVSPSEA